MMKNLIYTFLVVVLLSSCATSEYASKQSSQPKEKDYTIYRTLTEALRSEGLYVQNGEVTLRGKGSIFLNTSPLFVVDGMPFGHSLQSVSSSINMMDLQDIRIIRSTAQASIRYGEIANHGAILIFTKTHDREKNNDQVINKEVVSNN